MNAQPKLLTVISERFEQCVITLAKVMKTAQVGGITF